MKLSKIRIENFRGIKSLELNIGDLTTLIGKNGVGKSSILHALDFFKTTKYKIKVEDYYKKNISLEIKVSITFSDLSSQEMEEFRHYIQNNELKIIKIAVGNEEIKNPNVSQNLHGLRMQNREFQEIRKIDKANPKKDKYNELRLQEKYINLPNVTRGDQIEPNLVEWERNYPEGLELIRDDGKFFGWSGVGAGKLGKYLDFFFIPAVHEYSDEGVANGSTFFNELLNLTIRKIQTQSQEFSDFKRDTVSKYKEFIENENKGVTEKISSELTYRLKGYSPESNISLIYEAGEIQFRQTNYATEIEEFGFRGPISYLGHGTQRSFFFALLQYLAEKRTENKIEEQINSVQNEEIWQNSRQLILLIIEEPELYQHPNRIKMIKETFRKLTKGNPDIPFKFQIICSSHSPHFVQVRDFEQVRILRKKKIKNEYYVTVNKVDLSVIAEKLKNLYNIQDNRPFTEDSVISRLISVMNPEISEGFFADKVVLVEGLEDKAAIKAISKQISKESLESKNIQVIPVYGKGKLDRPALIFKEFNIPIYLIFDTDSTKTGDDRITHKKTNIALRNIMGQLEIEDSFEGIIEKNWASIDPTLTDLIKISVGTEFYEDEMNSLKKKYGFLSIKDCKKNYVVLEEFISICYKNNKKIEKLEKIVANIMNLE